MNVKKIIFSFGVTSILILGGCSKSSNRIGEDNAIQVAIDEANANNSDVKNLSCDETDNGYTISFDINDVQYVYKISGDGIIQDVKTKDITNDLVEEGSKTDSGETKNAENQEEENNSETSDSSQVDENEESNSELIGENQAVEKTLDYLQISTDDISNLQVDLDQINQIYTITYNYDTFSCMFTVNSIDGSLINIIVQ